MKKMLIALLCAASLGQSSVKAGLPQVLISGNKELIGGALAAKFVAELLAIHTMDKGTSKGVTLNTGANIASNAANLALLGVLGKEGFPKIKTARTKFVTTATAAAAALASTPGGPTATANDQIAIPVTKTEYTNTDFAVAGGVSVIGLHTLYSIIKNIKKLSNRTAIAEYHKDEQVQKFIASKKAGQYVWLVIDALLAGAAVGGLSYVNEVTDKATKHVSDKITNLQVANVAVVAGVLAILSEMLRAHKRSRLETATAEHPLNLPSDVSSDEDSANDTTSTDTPAAAA